MGYDVADASRTRGGKNETPEKRRNALLRKKILFRLLLPTLAAALAASIAEAQSLAPPSPPPAPPEARPAPPLAPPGQPVVGLPTQQRPLDLIATITLATGKSETFAREIDRLEIITGPGGGIELIHLVLVAGGERNTHVWYNYGQVAKLSYRFVTPQGSSKVYVRLLQASPSTRDLTERLEPLSPLEFR